MPGGQQQKNKIKKQIECPFRGTHAQTLPCDSGDAIYRYGVCCGRTTSAACTNRLGRGREKLLLSEFTNDTTYGGGRRVYGGKKTASTRRNTNAFRDPAVVCSCNMDKACFHYCFYYRFRIRATSTRRTRCQKIVVKPPNKHKGNFIGFFSFTREINENRVGHVEGRTECCCTDIRSHFVRSG